MLEIVADNSAPFRSVNHALAFAYNFTHGTLKRSGMARMMGGPSGTGKGLAGLDGAGQAGMIKSAIASMPAIYQNVLIARFAPMQDDCACGARCCRGWRESDDWGDAIDWLAEHILEIDLCGSVKHVKFRRAVVSRYFGAKVSFITIAGDYGVNRDTASSLNARIVDYFRGVRVKGKNEDSNRMGVEWRARTEFEQKLREHGVVEEG